jgi:hypothetical protein
VGDTASFAAAVNLMYLVFGVFSGLFLGLLVRAAREDDHRQLVQVLCRVIGLPGERVMLKDGTVFINGRALKEPFPTVPCPPEDDDDFVSCRDLPELEVPTGNYFLLADRRPNSEDSRYWRPATIERARILGRVTEAPVDSSTDKERAPGPEGASRDTLGVRSGA